MVVYLITNLVNGKRYVGQTIGELQARWRAHNRKNGGCVALSSALSKYGKENFQIKVLAYCDTVAELNHREKYYIKLFNTIAPNGYNLSTGGERPIFAQETRKRMSESAIARAPETRWNRGLSMDDPRVAAGIVPATIALRAKYGDSSPAKGKSWTEESRKRAVERMTGAKFSEETKNKMSDSHEKTKILCEQNNTIYDSIMDASRALGLNSGNIHNVLSGIRKRTKGYTFKRV